MSQQSLNNPQNNNNKEIYLSLINPKLFDIFNNRNYIINNFLLKKENINSNYLIDIKEKNIINLLLIFIIKTTKYRDVLKFLQLNFNYYKKEKEHIRFKNNTKELFQKLKLILPKILNICIFNSYELSNILNYNNKVFTKKIFELIHIFFLNNLIDKENLINIIRLKLISCLSKENNNEYNEEFLEIKNNTIKNIFSLETIINFLLLFKSVQMNKNKITEFINIINETMLNIEDLLLNNFNNNFLLSNSLLFYRLIELSQISLDCIVSIIPILIKVYKFTFKNDFFLSDLNEQFLLKKNENINNKINNIVAKNRFLYDLFNYQYSILQEDKYTLIQHGFVFNDYPNNGLILDNNKSFNFPEEAFSIVISFNIMNNTSKIINDKKKYTLFSLYKNEDIIDFNIFIENNILKISLFGKINNLFSNIEYNKIYVLWIFMNVNDNKSTSIFYLNEKKIIKYNFLYPKGFYNINLGFDNNKEQNNFVGIIGTFILFKNCFIKDEKSKEAKFYEETLIELKCNYECIIYIGYETIFSNLNSEIQAILNKLSSDNISRFIEVIISSKSVMSNDFCCCSNKRKKYIANYFMDKRESQSMISFNDENIDINLNNYNFNCQNCLITYPIHFNYAFDDFINNNGIKFLELELYYFMGVLDFYSTVNNNKEENELFKQEIIKLNEEKDLLFSKIQYIINLFLYCLRNINKIQEKKFRKDIDNFFYTFNNLIALTAKIGIKIDLQFLSSITNNLTILIEKKKFFDYCGFILEYESYNPNDDKVFEFLFQNILIYIEEYESEFLSPTIFSKILNFDKIYLSNILKDSKKIYSQLIRKCLSLSLINNNEESFKLYINKIIDLKGINEINKKEKIYSNIAEDAISEDAENYYINKNRSDLSFHKKNPINPEKIEKKEKNELILMYKALRNLYLSLEKKNKSYYLFINYCLESEENIIDFFNDEFNYLSSKYEIKEINSTKNDNYLNLSKDSGDNSSDNLSDNNNDNKADKNHNDNDNGNNNEKLNKGEIISEQYKINLIYSELIKSLCIRFIDEITYEDNIKNINNTISKETAETYKQNNKKNMEPQNGIIKTLTTYNLLAPRKNSIKRSFYLNAHKSSSNVILDKNPIEQILIKNFEFYDEFTLSPYTFNSFFLLLFRDLSTEKKLKYIKNINKNFDNLLLSQKAYNDISNFIYIILQLIERVGEEDLDTFFMNKIEFLEYVFDRFNSILLGMLDYYNDKKEEREALIKNFFCKKDFGTKFYLSIFDNLKRNKDLAGMIYVFNSQPIDNDKDEKKNNELIDNLFHKVKNKLNEIIDRTIFEIIEPFYFNLIFEIYIKDYKDNKNCDYALKTIQYIIDKFNQIENNDLSYNNSSIKEEMQLNHKNILLLIYKITFFVYKRRYLIENNIFIKPIVLYLSSFCNKTNLIFLKLLFPIEEKTETNKSYNKKLIIEMLFEIFIDLYLEFKKIKSPESFLFEALLNDLILNKASEIHHNKTLLNFGEDENKKKKSHKYSIFYRIDELSIKHDNAKLKSFSDYILKNYLKTSNPNENIYSVTILFLIKISIYIKKLEEVDKDSSLLDFLVKTSELLCKDAIKLQKNYSKYNPLISKNPNTTTLYEEFLNYITKDYIINKKFNKDELLLKITKNYKISRKYACVAYTIEGKARLFSINSHIQLIAGKKKFVYSGTSSSYGESGSRKGSVKEETSSLRLPRNLKGNIRNACSTSNICSSETNKGFFSKKREKIKFIDYKIIPKFLKFFVRSHFSLYFLKLLTYDEDFQLIKKIYNYIYHKEIKDIDDYNLNYPSKLKNRLGNNYVKQFLKKDFNFTSSQYFKYSHKCIYQKHFMPKTKALFPSKKILEEFDYAHKGIIINKEDKTMLTRNCELITYEGSIFGDVYFFQNCILFKSDLENDKRKINDLLDCACCSMEFDFLEVKKTKIIEFSEIKEVIPRKFLYSWISLEIFMKNGKSYLFNFFNEDTNNYILEFLKNKDIVIIKNVKEFFDKIEFTKKWKDGIISTYEHLLYLNKFASRSYNDSNQYPIMPWIFLSNNNIRNFDIPMSIQNEQFKKTFLQIPYDSQSKENRWHSNHYSTSAYICYYLMRINPFTDSMIKFQSNNFDVPDRQFCDVQQTLILCENNNNNREPIPELYTIPEVYINLNKNDFGKQTLNNQSRIHNVECLPYADNPYEFVYKFKFMLNNNEEINTTINLWFDFVFGINQYNKDNINGQGLRNFNKYCYGQNINITKMINDLKKKQKTDSVIYNEIKSVLGMVISFGQCPFQLLSYEHPKRVYTKGVHNILLTSAEKSKLSKDEEELFNEANEKINNINDYSYNDNTIEDGKMVQKLYDYSNKKCSIIYFRRSLSKNNLYCLLNSKEIEVYQKDSKKQYKFKRKINVSKNYLLFKKTSYGYPILKPKYLFCELKEDNFIFCRYLDNSIKLITPNMESQFLLDSFITSIIRINEKEFITGDNRGKLCHWKINLDNIMRIKLKLKKTINSNKNSITAILYNKKLNIIVSSDNNSVVIRSFHDFEFLSYFDIKKDENYNNNDELIVDIKLSNYDLIYILINKGNNNYKLKGYSLNGIFFGEYEGKITNFELTKEGRVLVGLANMGIVNVLDPITFKVLYSRFIISNEDESECLFYHFYFEKPNIIFFGFKDHEGSKIKLIMLNKDEIKFFI